uniref:Xpo1 domain-containing protein n=1 Tax=Heterorhabditis bacteriophora TaxID=37862 RepID=A0A1I7XM47_HETBA
MAENGAADIEGFGLDMSELEVLNRLCKELYESVAQSTRLRAEQNLAELADSPECLRRCMLLLEQGELPYGPLVASNTLMKLLNSKTGILGDQKLELSLYILNHLGARASSLPPFVVTSLCQLFARITKQEWTYCVLENNTHPFREPIGELIKTIDMANEDQSLLAVQLLSLLIVDMNSHIGMESVNKHRKCLSQFRDAYLFEIFQTSVSFLEDVAEKTNGQQQQQLVVAVLDLCLNCLLFDFIGSLSDETSEDNYNVQVPTIWRTAFTDGKIVTLIFRLYQHLPQIATEKVLHIAVQLASIRRTLFNGSERQTYLEQLVSGVKMIIDNPDKLSEQLMEFSANSTYFLLTFWQRMVTSVPYVRSSDDHLLNVYCPEIVTAFVESRLQNVERVVRDGHEDPLEDQGATLQIMEHLAIICRCEYEKTFQILAQSFDDNARILEAGPEGDLRVRIAEGRLIWLVTLIGTAVFGKTAVSNNEDHDKMDGELIARCLKFMRISDSRLVFPSSINSNPGKGNVRLEVAFVHMLEQFRRAYIMDQVSRISPVYEKLQNELGIAEETDMLSVIIQKMLVVNYPILTNLKFWATNDIILELSLSLFKDLSLGYTAVRKLFRLQEVQLLLSNHTVKVFHCLLSYYGTKTGLIIYSYICKISFIKVLATAREVGAVMSNSAYNGVTADQLRVSMNFKQLLTYPTMFNIMMRSVEVWADHSEVMTPIFRLLAELCQNRQQRLKFEMSSCSAVLLFKEASKIISAYGNRLLMLPDVPKERAYKERFKNIGVIFNVLKSALVGAYVPFVLSYFLSTDAVVITSACSSLDTILNYLYKRFTRTPNPVAKVGMEPEGDMCLITVKNQPQLMSELLTSMMSSLMFGEVKCQWSMSRPLLGLILLQEEVFTSFKREVISQQPTDRQAAFDQVKWISLYNYITFKTCILQTFNSLMDGVERTLTVKNKDVFTQNLSKFRRDVVEIIKGKDVSPSASSHDMC